MVSTNAPKTTITVTVGSAAWITTATVPAIIADTGMRSLNPSKHSQESPRKEGVLRQNICPKPKKQVVL